ncbi:MAG: hypothetical protein U0U09_18615 [Cyclobacteriaceae bacterium]
MDNVQQHTVNTRIQEYLTGKISQIFPDDFHLISNLLPKMIDRYSLKELVIICRIEIDRIKNGERSARTSFKIPPLA